jgi:arsenate reductase
MASLSQHPVVLFLSTRNASRSQIAEALLRKAAGDQFTIYSAGLEAGEIDPHTLTVLEEVGADTSVLKAKDVKPYLGKLDVRYVITVSHRAAEKGPTVFPGAIYYFAWELDDPENDQTGSEAEILARYRALRDQIDAKIQEWLQQIEAMGNKRKTAVS